MSFHLVIEVPDQGRQVFSGRSVGYQPEADEVIQGEVVFQTGMVGYPESLTDPSYKNQILVLTYPIIGSYGVPSLPQSLESDNIQVSGLIMGECVSKQDHWASKKDQTFSEWLLEHRVPALEGIDTRELTKIIREHGTLVGYITNNINIIESSKPPLIIPKVSIKEPKIYDSNTESNVRVLAIDCGMKRNQLNMLLKGGASVKVVPWDYQIKLDFVKETNFKPTHLFISNGPGDPQDYKILIENLKEIINDDYFAQLPIFGICLGHQLLSLAAGASSYKMKYGNRGHNIPCQLVGTQRCLITSQNHGYAIDPVPLEGTAWKPLFINPNDNSNEGIHHTEKPYYSVQFHPEAKAGPEDSAFMFDLFLEKRMHEIFEILTPKTIQEPKHERKRVLVIGSGGLCIGQSGEFDYSGSQAIKAFKEEGLQVILVNPNVATVQTSSGFADKVYYLPIKPEYILKVIKVERPDCITLSFGGQTALNCGVKLYEDGIFEKYQIEILGSPIESVILSEDRERFKNHLATIGESTIPSFTAETPEEAEEAVQKLGGFPVLIRASFALGGLGSGFAYNEEEFNQIVNKAFAYSKQVIVDKSLKGWKEVEYEVVRDAYDNCICVCNMENFDPLGVHTGESIVVAPSQTLNNDEYQMLRTTAIKTIRSLKIVGECNIQYALCPTSNEFFIVEVNARLSRSSALASKATGYPLAYVAAKLGLGYSLVELKNSMTQSTVACFEPSLDYLVVKVPRWDLSKFPKAVTKLDSSMKSIGEAMGIGRSFEEALQKALRMANDGMLGFEPNKVPASEEILTLPTYQRIFALATALYEDQSVESLHERTHIDLWFLHKLENIISEYRGLEHSMLKNQIQNNIIWLKSAKKVGFSDKQIALCTDTTESAIRKIRQQNNIFPYVKKIDTVAAEFPCYTNYLYTTYNATHHDVTFESNTDQIMVLGSGVYRIGSSVEFDWCSVHCIRELRANEKKVIMINCNPETVSTDYDEADKLYFEELSFESVMDIYQLENPEGVILSVGGQAPNNIAMALHRQKVKVLGTSPENIDNAENRFKFSRLLDQIQIDQPKWRELTSTEEAIQFCKQEGYPCLVRPSYVLSGKAMNVAFNDRDLVNYLKSATNVSEDHPVVISKFIQEAKEIEVDAVAQNGTLKIIAISEHVENAGVHSGDATLFFPPQDLTSITMQRIKESTVKIAQALKIHGPFNIQFMAKNNELKVIECNLRVSRTFPFVSKTMNYNLIQIATQVMLNNLKIEVPEKIKSYRVGVKVPCFSFSRLKGADISLGVEMVSTGEVACFGKSKYEAYLKGIQASDVKLPEPNSNILISIGSYKMKEEFVESVKLLSSMGYKLLGTSGSFDFYDHNNIQIEMLNTEQILMKLKKKQIGLVINISNKIRFGSQSTSQKQNDINKVTDGYKIRRSSIDNGIPLVTDIKNGKLYVKSLEYLYRNDNQIRIDPKMDCFTDYQPIRLPGLIDVHVHLREPGKSYKEDWASGTKAALAGGVTMIGVMPNTDPAITNTENQELIKKLATEKAHCDWGVFMGANSNNYDLWLPHDSKQNPKITEGAFALKLYLNNTYGPLLLEDTQVWMKHIQNWPKNRPICCHAEGLTLAAVLHIAHLANRHIHVCHVSSKEEILLIKASKENGQNVTCEVAPHHLFLTCKNFDPDSPLKEVKPPLMESEDQQALWDNLDIIDCFATDHAPHTKEDKVKCKCPGFPGLETAMPLLLTAVNQGRLTLQDIIDKYHTNPKKIFSLPDQEDTYIEIDLHRKYKIPDYLPYTKCGWTPFNGMEVQGAITRVVLRGKTVYVDGEILSTNGYGQDVRKNQELSQSSSAVELELQIQKTNPINTINPSNESNKFKKSKLRNLFTVEQLDYNILKLIFAQSDFMRKSDPVYLSSILKNKIMASIFYEPSTRTRCSFTSAMKRLGGEVIDLTAQDSSIKKGESFSDCLKTMETYTDLLVVRSQYPHTDISDVNLNVPVINAGDGAGEHPTQALLDLYTIRQERGTINGLTIALVGDLKYGRTVHSLAKLLALYRVNLIYIPAEERFSIPEEIKEYIAKKNPEIQQTSAISIESCLNKIDVLYMTRMQRERFGMDFDTKMQVITPKTLTKAKENLVIMHPLPRNNEISPEIDSDPRAAYFRQMENGLYVRMALLQMLLQ